MDRAASFINIDNLEVLACAKYEDFVKKIIGTQKNGQSSFVISLLAQWIHQKLPNDQSSISFIPVPTSPFSKLHLVETLTLELQNIGHPYFLPIGKKTFSKKQKFLSVDQREFQTNEYYPVQTLAFQRKRAPTPVLLLDDVLTTGSTLSFCKDVLEKHFSDIFELKGACVLAYTPKYC
ncbi:MAG: ComF family protein [Bacteriovoracia bacterium]